MLSNNYTNNTITGTLIPRTAAQSDRGATDNDYAKIQDIVADQLPVLPVWQAKQYAVTRDNVYGLEYCLDGVPLLGTQQELNPPRRHGEGAPVRKGRPLRSYPVFTASTARRGVPARSRTRTPPPAPGRAGPAW